MPRAKKRQSKAAKKTAKKQVRKKSSRTAEPASSCDRGDETHNLGLTIHKTDKLELFFQVCEGVGQIVAFLGNLTTSDQRKVAEAMGVDEQGRQLRINTSTLQLGSYVLTWTFRVDDDDDKWHSVHEIEVNDVVLFRLYKSSDSNRPTNTIFMFLDVVQ